MASPVDRLGADRASAVYWGMGAHLGQPWPQNHKGHLLGDVTDQGKSGYDPTSRGNEIGGVAFPFHSDGSDLVGLFCLDSGAGGGASLVANAVSIHNELVRTAPDLAAELYEPFAYDMRGEEKPGTRPWYLMPVFTQKAHRLFTRYIRPYILSARRHPDAPAPSAAASEAMDRVDAMCADPAFHLSMQLRPGDMQFVNNYHVLHARDAYTDDRAMGQVRHLKRSGWRPACSRTRTSPRRFGSAPPPTPGGRRPVADRPGRPESRVEFMDPTGRAAHLLALHRPGEPLLAPNPWDVGSAKLLESLGFAALCTTSSGAAATLGGLDGSMDRDAAVASAGAIAAAVDVPVSADLENGFGDAPEDAAETIQRALVAGLSGGSIEDYSTRPDDPIYPIEQAAERVGAAVEVAHGGPVHFVLTARAENLHPRSSATWPTRSAACRPTRRPGRTCSTRPAWRTSPTSRRWSVPWTAR